MGNNATHEMTITGDDTCVICQEHVDGKISRPNSCDSHFFHHDCLMEWSKHKNTCPLDNKEFSAIIDNRGKKIPVKKPAEAGDGISISSLFEHMLMLSQIMRLAQQCAVCGEDNHRLERAKTDACEHRFHRKCLTSLSRINNVCPIDDCGKEFSEISCEFGEEIKVSDLNETSVCLLCRKSFSEGETATGNHCAHRYHRTCLYREVKLTKMCPNCKSDVLYLKCENGDRVVIQGSFDSFECYLCKATDTEKEPLRISPCGHRFHRGCFLSMFRNLAVCPIESCGSNIEIAHCMYGDAFQVQRNSINNIIATVTCDSNFLCTICKKQNPDMERAKLDCNCEFHRQCIESRFRRERKNFLCPVCEQASLVIRCLHGDRIEITEDDELSTSSPSAVTDVSPPTDSSTEGAVGGESEETVCNLCEHGTSEMDKCRPKECSHWYHLDCMRTLCDEFDCCIMCQADLKEVLDGSNQKIKITQNSAQSGPPQSPTTTLQCFTCGKSISANDAVHPNNCACLFHRNCLTSIKEIISFCPICDANFETIESLPLDLS